MIGLEFLRHRNRFLACVRRRYFRRKQATAGNTSAFAGYLIYRGNDNTFGIRSIATFPKQPPKCMYMTKYASGWRRSSCISHAYILHHVHVTYTSRTHQCTSHITWITLHRNLPLWFLSRPVCPAILRTTPKAPVPAKGPQNLEELKIKITEFKGYCCGGKINYWSKQTNFIFRLHSLSNPSSQSFSVFVDSAGLPVPPLSSFSISFTMWSTTSWFAKTGREVWKKLKDNDSNVKQFALPLDCHRPFSSSLSTQELRC